MDLHFRDSVTTRAAVADVLANRFHVIRGCKQLVDLT